MRLVLWTGAFEMGDPFSCPREALLKEWNILSKQPGHL